MDHDITLKVVSADLPELLDSGLAPLPLDQIEDEIQNASTATLELDGVYGLPAPGADRGCGSGR